MDPVFIIQIRIRLTQEDRIQILLRYVFDVKQNNYIFYGSLLPNLCQMTLKIKDNKLYFNETVHIIDNFYLARNL